MVQKFTGGFDGRVRCEEEDEAKLMESGKE
jgi:hypothetical protein